MNTLSFYQIGTEYQKLLPHLYDIETGEVNIEVEAQLNALTDSAEKKSIALVSFIKCLESEQREVAYLKEEISKREAAYKKKIDKLHQYLKDNMLRSGVKEISSPLFTIKLKENPYSTEIVDESLIPEKYMRKREIVKTEIKPDKNAIKEDVLANGIQVPGALVQRKMEVKITVDKV